MDCSLPGFSLHGILQARTLEWVAISFSNAWKWEVKVKSLSRVWLLAPPWTVAYQAPPSLGFSRQEYWSGVPLPSPGDFPNPGIEPGSPALQVDSLPSKPPGKPVWTTTNCGKFFKEMRTPDHLTWLMRKLYVGQEATVRTRHGTTDWFQIGKEVYQGCILSPCLFNLYAEFIIRNGRLNEAQTGVKIAGRNINNLRYADDTHSL